MLPLHPHSFSSGMVTHEIYHHRAVLVRIMSSQAWLGMIFCNDKVASCHKNGEVRHTYAQKKGNKMYHLRVKKS